MAISSTIQAEIQRKAAAGIPLTNPTAETTAAYNAAKAKLAPVNNTTTNTNNVAVKPAPTAPIANAATGGTASATGYGGATYGTNAATNAAILANQNKLATDKNFLQSEIDRTLQTIKDREAQGLDTSAQYKYLNQNLGYSPSTGVGVGSPNNTNIFNPGSYGGYDPTAEEQAYLANQIAAYNGQADAAKLAAQYGIDQNNAALAEQLEKLNQQKAVDTNAAQELQNRRGGFYSGGLDTQLASIDSGYANNVNTLTRDVASRNQQLLDQYGNTANTIAEQINNLQQNAPDILRSRIQDWINNERNYGLDYANSFGSLNGKQTLAAQGQQFSQDLQTRQQDLTEKQINAELTGFLPDGTPTNQYQQQQLDNYWKAADETGVIPDTLATILKIPKGTPTQQAKEFVLNYNRGILESDRTYNRGVLESDRNYNLDVAREGRLASEDSGSAVDPLKQLSNVADIIDKSAQYTTDLKTGNKVLSNSDAVEKQILNSGLPEYQMWQLYQRYNIPWQGAIPSPN